MKTFLNSDELLILLNLTFITLLTFLSSDEASGDEVGAVGWGRGREDSRVVGPWELGEGEGVSSLLSFLIIF